MFGQVLKGLGNLDGSEVPGAEDFVEPVGSAPK